MTEWKQAGSVIDTIVAVSITKLLMSFSFFLANFKLNGLENLDYWQKIERFGFITIFFFCSCEKIIFGYLRIFLWLWVSPRFVLSKIELIGESDIFFLLLVVIFDEDGEASGWIC